MTPTKTPREQLIKGDHAEKNNVIPFANTFNHISPLNLDEIMEWLDNQGYLSEKGRTFHSRFWSLFIKQ